MDRALMDSLDVQSFWRDGVVVLRNVLSSEEIGLVADAIARADTSQSRSRYDVTDVSRQIWSHQDGAVEQKSADQYDLDAMKGYLKAMAATPLRDSMPDGVAATGHFTLETDAWMRDAGLAQIAMHSALPGLAAHLLKSDRINFFDDQIFVKEPYSAERTAYHQDLSYFNITGNQACVMWIPVDTVRKESGAVRYVRGSHLWNKVFKPNVFISDTAFPGAEGEDMPDIAALEGSDQIVSFEMQPGDVAVHHVLTVHGAGGNLTDKPRRAASLRYCGDDVRYQTKSFTPAHPWRQIDLADGDRLRGPQFPQVWLG
jgi:hypothetical protein